jgi:AcrR family transcriptional regulator
LSTAQNKGVRADARRNRARILAAADEVFAENGPAASTEQIATRAGVASGTIFRHFPTKQALLQAIMKDLLQRLIDEADALAADGDPETALSEFFTRTVEQAARKHTVIDLLTQSGMDPRIAEAVRLLHDGVHRLLARAQAAGAVRPDVGADEVVVLLAAMCQATAHSGWNAELQSRTLEIIFQGLR